eukprot:6440365-Heterocapsa_arctica.AAC.1
MGQQSGSMVIHKLYREQSGALDRTLYLNSLHQIMSCEIERGTTILHGTMTHNLLSTSLHTQLVGKVNQTLNTGLYAQLARSD